VIRIEGPAPQHWPEHRRLGPVQQPDPVNRDLVHVVPPGARDDQFLVQREQVAVLPLRVAAMPGQVDRRIPFFAEGGFAP
jgi:hypothetical protein